MIPFIDREPDLEVFSGKYDAAKIILDDEGDKHEN